jgi:hypothetical protein
MATVATTQLMAAIIGRQFPLGFPTVAIAPLITVPVTIAAGITAIEPHITRGEAIGVVIMAVGDMLTGGCRPVPVSGFRAAVAGITVTTEHRAGRLARTDKDWMGHSYPGSRVDLMRW